MSCMIHICHLRWLLLYLSPEWPQDAQIKCYLKDVSVNVFLAKFAFESVDYEFDCPPNVNGVSPSPLKSKENKKASLLALLLELGHLISFHLHIFFCSWTGIYTIGSLVLRPLNVD